MISQNFIEKINELVGNKTFKYSGELISGSPNNINIEYRFQITGVKKMISVGEYYDYLLINVTIIGLNDPLSRLVFGFDEKNKHHNFEAMFKTQLYPFYNGLNQAIASYLRFFDNDYVRITINDLNFDLPNSETITESRMSRVAVRTTVKDVVYKLKDGKSGNFRLPSDDEYIFTNLPFSYTVDLTLKVDNKLDGYETSSKCVDYNDVIELVIRFNPKTLKKNFYNIIGELNDIIAHELEHLHQYFKGEDIDDKHPKESLEYYLQPQEIKSQRVGFRRLAKLRKLPYKQVIQDWFNTHKETHNLNDEEIKIVINTLLNK
jgi:hypothetical protein